jgi:hypothetical protein
MKPLLERLPVLFVGHIFYGDGVIIFAGFTALLGLALSLLWNIYILRRGS